MLVTGFALLLPYGHVQCLTKVMVQKFSYDFKYLYLATMTNYNINILFCYLAIEDSLKKCLLELLQKSFLIHECRKSFWNDCTHNSRLQKFPIDIEIWLLGGTPTLMNIENCPKVICHQVADTLQFETHLAASSYILDERNENEFEIELGQA